MTRMMPIAGDRGSSGASGASLLAARICLATVFLYSGATKLVYWSAGIEEFAALGLPIPALALAATVVLQIGAGMALSLGWHSSLAALALAAFTVAATLIGHPFWAFEGDDFHRQLTTALEHLAIIGGLVAIAAVGPGPFSLQPREHSS
ncbi:DoxX family protein [Inquilinus sp. CAU 1745]|uniref:DoxX family protein n=1 Tax=Inquilinus sp. CAU 1745 TaxID=3140369 RepID=UPI00325AAFAD